jgi:RNA polymerase subunit RPABC4/transcription elongation factor Spt4
MKECFNCGKLVRNDATYCPYCRTQLEGNIPSWEIEGDIVP